MGLVSKRCGAGTPAMLCVVSMCVQFAGCHEYCDCVVQVVFKQFVKACVEKVLVVSAKQFWGEILL